MKKLEKLFDVEKPIVGMIHLAGGTSLERLDRALLELTLYKKHGIDGAILEDYHGSEDDVYNLLKELKGDYSFPLGINLLRSPYKAFEWAIDFGLKYIQFDSVYARDLDVKRIGQFRASHPDILVLGGVQFKYIDETNRTLEEDLAEGLSNSDCIVTTGDGTGVETDIEKLRNFRLKMPEDVDLVVGAGVKARTAYQQLSVADSAIVGSYFKNGDTKNVVIEQNLSKFMVEIYRLRYDLFFAK